MPMLRRLCRLVAPCAAAFYTLAASAQENLPAYPQPGQTVRIIIPATAGGTTDILARVLARHLQEDWKVPVIVDNKPGAGGVIGATTLLAARADGHTVMMVPSAFGVRSAIDHALPYDPLRDIAGVGLIARSPSFLVVAPSQKITTVDQLVALGKSMPDGLTFGSAGVGSTAHLHGAMFARVSGFQALHVPYRGTPEAIVDVMGGRLTYAFAPAPNVINLAKNGSVVILGSSSEEGSKFIPGTPTLPQQKTPGYDGADWFGFVASSKMPKAYREKLSVALARIVQLPDVREAFIGAGAEPVSSTSEEMDAMLRKYITDTRKLANDMKITVD
ncbi:Bug family tripartite tricarboxylate transporter substrate binding protein [Bordetella genomosp. 13]|uniref:Bug family tripartite tricarboxylate transporter substrate binding protein n=1 Tax=Bordetella genomosp. 13 TaxID=463040 RepID=UPI0011A5B6E5|nr:tripartite tricarboxylate transporter substrate-binding protein [Bordetella genomosp. 13]